MRHLIAVMMTLCVISSAQAGLIMNKSKRVTFGEVIEGTNVVLIKIKLGSSEGKLRPAKSSLIWWTAEDSVVDYYTGAKHAYAIKNYKIANFLAQECTRREPQNKANAQDLLRLLVNLKQKGDLSVKADDGEEGDADTDAEGTAGEEDADDADDASDGDESELYKKLKDHLLDPTTGEKYKGKAWGKAKYYMLCFVSLKYAENRDVLRRVIGQYESAKKDYDGKVEFLFYPIDRDPKVLATQIPKLKIPFPILKRSIAAKTTLIKLKSSSASFAVVDASGNLVPGLKGDNQHKLLRDLEDKMDEAGE